MPGPRKRITRIKWRDSTPGQKLCSSIFFRQSEPASQCRPTASAPTQQLSWQGASSACARLGYMTCCPCCLLFCLLSALVCSFVSCLLFCLLSCLVFGIAVYCCCVLLACLLAFLLTLPLLIGPPPPRSPAKVLEFDSSSLPTSTTSMLVALSSHGVQVETVSLRCPLIFITARVLNVAFEKSVFVRWTTDNWHSTQDEVRLVVLLVPCPLSYKASRQQHDPLWLTLSPS